MRDFAKIASVKANESAIHSIVCTDYVGLFSRKVNLKVFCIRCLFIILCDTSTASENLTYILKQSAILSSVIIICKSARRSKIH